MKTVQIKEAQSRLPELVESLASVGEVIITRDERPVARLVPPQITSLRTIQPASAGAVLRAFSNDDDLLDEMLSQCARNR